ncbi:GntR family transcriptional regulator [Glaciimonas sp. CA11.2]|uniref:GntR family transcriptional regulator n=1 Tax=Glaciimonas sp. CA11.2 TaxID=3048601 RepID=UPI002AB43A93|nr:GntR family transcriptional regulator [Glaciimonas sp. CA11.2]MDY7548285.1 GntR family transcriptional regulator [Glaciimonas sp. CA11.2]MEB0165023.1 GntR family transcriptional regulator [Glaciimonas sp. CA11.2]
MTISELVIPLKRQTMSVEVYNQLKELLMSGRMMPGEQLSLRTVAAALGVSVMPVREAMQRLVAEQALVLTLNRTLRVPTMTVSQFREITQIRINLEGLATEQATYALQSSAVRKISELHQRFANEMALTEPDSSVLVRLNKELHFAIYQGACMPMLMQLIETLWVRVGPILNYDLHSGSRRVVEQVAVSHHLGLIDALERRDGIAARAALQGDIESAAEFIVSAGVLVIADAPT